ncbi:leucyl/phenylalanyl-tRNA--protein transferase [Pseudohongiella acticola]|uniref:Leucyl/phenylalanyl-tRNA--protein transferase n=1 Tax=Pseudohongiella acticola TaxID=1524254 RepID=A0A1E8CHT8_9GAMM|nr:leucyl/phenylalanyl-tRNA--protein transferase [Pseudohongiella acticola]OFE11932.1 leucyl/phenylalanyl-tRNA--protein transferase [Pseudohongiella acticola]
MISITWLHPDNLDFPPVGQAFDDPPGLLAAGGDLRPERLLSAYARGIFPWYDDDSPILWWSPDPRMVLRPSDVHVSRSLAKLIRQGRFRITMDTAFADVIHACAALRAAREGTWITDEMQNAYIALHTLGHAHSVEIWDGDQLVGGLYGVAMGKLFFGESMFSVAPNTSKIAFVALATQLQNWGFALIDCQMPTDHLQSLGAHEMSRAKFQNVLQRWCEPEPANVPWVFDNKLL